MTALSVPRKKQETEDLGNEVQGEDMSGASFTDADEVLEVAEAVARKRCSEAFSKRHRREEEPDTKRLKTAPETVPSKLF